MEKPIGKEELLRMADGFGCALCDHPFESDPDIAVLRRKDNRKRFGICFCVPRRTFGGGDGSELALNVKCDPALSHMLCETYAGVAPGYHMNKRYWISVRLDGSVPRAEVAQLLRLSCDIVAPKPRAHVKNK